MAKKALLVGINRYKIPGADLRGCVNDVKNLRAVLTAFYGFAAKNIRTLTDYAATTKAMRDAIATLVKGAKKGDVLLFHYSGHGANVPDKNGDEADRRDEILCPTDLDWKDPLLDDWLRTTFDRLPAGVSFTVIMDCCHSGTNTRALLPPDAPVISRYLPNPWDLMAIESGRSLRGKVKGRLRRSTPARRKKDIVAVNIPEVLVTGCRDTQTSADAEIGGSFNGALTYNLVATIKAARGKLTYRELHDGTAKRLKQGGFSQVPQLEGRAPNLDRPFLSPLA
jgi:metacaspase-1